MRGRRPRPLIIPAADRPILEFVAHDRRLAWFQVQHARIILATADGGRVSDLADRLECDRTTIWRICRRYEQGGLKQLLQDDPRLGHPLGISPPPAGPDRRTRLPGARRPGLHITHWSSEDLARQAVADDIVEAISHATIRRILHHVGLQPHRTRYWRAARLDERFKERAEKVLWCYGNAQRLARRGTWVVCTDEVPNLQVLERVPIKRAIPGHIERQEFEYTRHGTVDVLLFLVVHTGRMDLMVLGANDATHYIRALRQFRRQHRRLKGVFLIHDGGPSHIAGATSEYLAGTAGWWRPRPTPAHASWPNQAEMLAKAFGGRYLKRASWVSRGEFIAHVLAACPEYNRLYAHPLEWTWTNNQMRKWFAEHALSICCTTCERHH